MDWVSIILRWLLFATLGAFSVDVSSVLFGEKHTQEQRIAHWINWVMIPVNVIVCSFLTLIIALLKPSLIYLAFQMWSVFFKRLFMDFK
jgi:hypothetical protein